MARTFKLQAHRPAGAIDLARDGMPHVRLVLAGGPALEERFASPKLDSFNQRLAARCYLQPLTEEETKWLLQSSANYADYRLDYMDT